MYKMFFRFPELAFKLDVAALGTALIVATLAATLGVLSAVRRAARLPPAEAMRPEPPANYRPSFIERTGVAVFCLAPSCGTSRDSTSASF